MFWNFDILKNKINNSLHKKDLLLQRSDVFCMSPWLQLNAQVNGYILPCCMSTLSDETKLGDLNDNPDLKSSWNSERMKALRKDMLNGRKNKLCENCYKYEKLGNISERQKYNRDYADEFYRVHQTHKDGHLNNENILILDVRFSNLCNYKCRICTSICSSLWYEEEKKLGMPLPNDNTKKVFIPSEHPEFSKSFYRCLDSIHKIHFAGGEPLVMDEHYKSLEYLISKGKRNVKISYNSNFSTLKHKNWKVIDLWNQFDSVDMWASLDGMFERGDYMRKGQKWQNILDNFVEVNTYSPHVKIGINITVSILNIFHIEHFIKYLIDEQLATTTNINLYLLFAPKHFNIINLPHEIKLEIEKRLNIFIRDYVSLLNENERLTQHILSIIEHMHSEQGNDLHLTKEWLNKIDRLRKENYLETFPELNFL